MAPAFPVGARPVRAKAVNLDQVTPMHRERLLIWAVGILLLVRLASLALYPLTDTTEARYADIARNMVEGDDWVTPRFVGGEPFWGKPPLSFWATALGLKLFGSNEFAARLPHLMLGAVVMDLVWRHAGRKSRRAAWHATALLAGTALFLVSSGAVMTDMALTAGTTLVMVGFWSSLHDPKSDRVAFWQMAFGTVLGLLAKGPVAIVLCGVPIVAWAALTGNLRTSWRRVAWLRLAVIVLALSLPWYLLAESRTPGFLRYFIIGEHWHRFITPGWTGDLYGGGHKVPHGMIWIFALAAAGPWSLILPGVWLSTRRRRRASRNGTDETGDSHARYLWVWALTSCVFFTFASNVIWTYVLPGLPAFAILGAGWTSRSPRRTWDHVLAGVLFAWSLALAGIVLTEQGSERLERNSTKSLVNDYRTRSAPGRPLYFWVRYRFPDRSTRGARVWRSRDCTTCRTTTRDRSSSSKMRPWTRWRPNCGAVSQQSPAAVAAPSHSGADRAQRERDAPGCWRSVSQSPGPLTSGQAPEPAHDEHPPGFFNDRTSARSGPRARRGHREHRPPPIPSRTLITPLPTSATCRPDTRAKVTIQASAVSPMLCASAHLTEPDSWRVIANVAMHGVAISANIMMHRPTSGV